MLEQLEHESVEVEKTEAIEGQEEKQESPENEKEKAKKRLSDRLKEQTFKWREEQRKSEALAKEVQELKAKLTIKDEPRPDSYDDRDKYDRDRGTWEEQERARIRKEESERLTRKQQEEREIEEIRKQEDDYKAGRAGVAKEDPNLSEHEKLIDDVVEEYRAPEIRELIYGQRKQGPKLVSYLGNNPDELEKLANSSPKERLVLMGKLLAKLEAKPVKTISSAPNPTRSEKGSAQRPAAPTGKAFDKSKESWQAYARRINGFK